MIETWIRSAMELKVSLSLAAESGFQCLEKQTFEEWLGKTAFSGDLISSCPKRPRLSSETNPKQTLCLPDRPSDRSVSIAVPSHSQQSVPLSAYRSTT